MAYSTFNNGGHFLQWSKAICYYGKGHYEEHFSKIILNFD